MGRVKWTRTDSNSAKPPCCSGDKHRQNQTVPSRTLPIHWAAVNRSINAPKFIWFTDIRITKAVHFTLYHITTIPIHFVPIDLTCKGFTAFFTSCNFACSVPMKSYNMWNMTKCHASSTTLILNSFTCTMMVFFFPAFLQVMYFLFYFHYTGLCVCCFVSFLPTPTILSQPHWFYNASVYSMSLPFLISYLYSRLFNCSLLFASLFLIFL